MKWKDIIQEKPSKKHENQVMSAVMDEMKSQGHSNGVFKWWKGLAGAAIPLAVALFTFKMVFDSEESEEGQFLNALLDKDLHQAMEDSEFIAGEFEIYEDLDLLEHLEVLEKLPEYEKQLNSGSGQEEA